MSENSGRPEHGINHTVILADNLAAWLRDTGFPQTNIAVDFADIIAAARRVEELLPRLVSLHTDDGNDAEQALACVGKLHAWLFGEMKHHLEELEHAWPALEAHFEKLAPE